LATDVDVKQLAAASELYGREIKAAVIDAAFEVALAGRQVIEQTDFIQAVRRVEENRVSVGRPKDGEKVMSLSPEEVKVVEDAIKNG
jgi:ATP-dependent 26S proteasome regulatory subunit